MDSRVVLYSSSSVMWSTRAWWLLHYLGYERMSVLDGGFDAWRAAGRPVETAVPRFPRGDFQARPRPDTFADKQAVADAIGDPSVCTVNSLGAAMHRGESRSSYARQGRIAGSGNLPFSELLTEGRFKSADEMREVLAASGMLDADRVITYCGAGIAATIDAFACVLVGQDRVAVYDGSLSEWALDPDAPMEVGRRRLRPGRDTGVHVVRTPDPRWRRVMELRPRQLESTRPPTGRQEHRWTGVARTPGAQLAGCGRALRGR